MREILFRGKQKDNGEWVEGYYNYATDGYNLELHLISDKITGIHTEVIPETVGQYTGLTDKNGKKIFEGDIVRNPETSDVGEIYFDTNTATFAIKFASFIVNFCDYNNSDVEVIGNIHDKKLEDFENGC